MKNEKYDPWFDEAFDEAFERAAAKASPPVPDQNTKRQSWLQVKEQLERSRRQSRRRRRFQLTGIVAASIATGAIFFSPPTISQAVSPIYQQLKDWGNGIVMVITGKDEIATNTVPKTSPPPEGIGPEMDNNLSEELLWSSSSEDHDLSLEEVKARLTFPYPEFQYIPPGYQFYDVLAAPMNEEAPIDDMSVQYISEDGAFLNISFYNLAVGQTSVSSLGSVTAETLILESGIEAIYIEGNASSIQFNYNNVVIRIVGELSKEDLLKMANSLP
ncbi:DUF4367 domain-containing protein [Paenibacillus faecalis]|uniref:DUF4367 domain-containing protein n=1 Tax=Paenibacillus faecalis TaxID=2079532 RepID=UPI000D106861|nr:DUF4367 domain-containing protein [Paenibacillus faecalis]